MQEPKDGDFIAYIEALQRESAARLAQQHVGIVETTAASKATGQFFEEKPKSPAVPSPLQAVDRFVRRDADARVVKALVAGVAGLAFLLTWLGNRGPITLVIALALLVYAIPRLVAAFRALTQQPASRATIDQVFGRSGNQTTGTKK
jgi:hypothetical protein